MKFYQFSRPEVRAPQGCRDYSEAIHWNKGGKYQNVCFFYLKTKGNFVLQIFKLQVVSGILITVTPSHQDPGNKYYQVSSPVPRATDLTETAPSTPICFWWMVFGYAIV